MDGIYKNLGRTEAMNLASLLGRLAAGLHQPPAMLPQKGTSPNLAPVPDNLTSRMPMHPMKRLLKDEMDAKMRAEDMASGIG